MSAHEHALSPTITESYGADKTATEGAPDSSVASPQERELAELIVVTLNLEVAAAEINPAAPLYREGLGLDSIDVLELALAISKTYGLQLRSDDENNLKIFSSLRSLNRHIQQHRTK
jgi:acyl carrier protein